jgi:hypothetical protein
MAKMDWAFTEDGDLSLGEARLDDSGKILYKHKDGIIDTEKGEDGLEIRDIGVVGDSEVDKQIILNRLRTDSPDWYHHPGMGGNLTDLIGEPNTRETGDIGAALIRRALTYRNLYTENQLSIRAIPLSVEQMVFMIDISKFNSKVFRFPLVFNLQNGLMDFYKPAK